MAYVAKKFSLDALNTALAANQQTFERQAHNDQQKMGMQQLEMQVQQQGFENRSKMMQMSMEAQTRAHEQSLQSAAEGRAQELHGSQVRLHTSQAALAEGQLKDLVARPGIENEAIRSQSREAASRVGANEASAAAQRFDTSERGQLSPHVIKLAEGKVKLEENLAKKVEVETDEMILRAGWQILDRNRDVLRQGVELNLLRNQLETEKAQLQEIQDDRIRGFSIQEHDELVKLHDTYNNMNQGLEFLLDQQAAGHTATALSPIFGKVKYLEDGTPSEVTDLRDAWKPIANAFGYKPKDAPGHITSYFTTQVDSLMAADPEKTQEQAMDDVFREMTTTAVLDMFSKLNDDEKEAGQRLSSKQDTRRRKSYQAYLDYNANPSPETLDRLFSFVSWETGGGKLKVVNDSYNDRALGDKGHSLKSNWPDYYNVVVPAGLGNHISDNQRAQGVIDMQLDSLEATGKLVLDQTQIVRNIGKLKSGDGNEAVLKAYSGASY